VLPYRRSPGKGSLPMR